MSKELHVKADVIGQLRLFKSVTFTDPYAFIDEALQNAQRAKAKTVRITVKSDKITIADDGIGLEDPESLFTMSKTGWDEATKEDQNPFGLGFFSCVALAGVVEVYSNSYYYKFDISKMFSTGNTAIEQEELPFPEPGFKVILTELIEGFDKYKFKSKVEESSKYISEFEIYLNEVKLDTIDYTKTDGSKFAEVVDESKIKGWIKPYDWYNDSGEQGIDIYHQNRFVTKLSLQGLKGTLSIGKGVLDFKAPDRRDIIQNDKYTIFLGTLNGLAKRAIGKILLDGSSEEIERYQDIISKYLTPDDYRMYMRYWVIDNKEILNEITEMKQKGVDLSYSTTRKLKALFDKSKRSITESMPTPKIDEPLESTSFMSWISPSSGSYGCYTGSISGTSESAEVRKLSNKLKDRSGIKLDELKNPPAIFYVRPSDLSNHTDWISHAVEAKIPVIIAKNNLETKVLSNTAGVSYLGDLGHKIVYKAKVTDPGPKDDTDIRALRMLKLYSELLGLETNPFVIGNCVFTKNYMFGDKIFRSEKLKTGIMTYHNKTLVDRKLFKSIRKSGDEDWKTLTLGELFFLIGNLADIIQETSKLPGSNRKILSMSQTLEILVNDKVYDWISSNKQ
jgi:hypothetical protein